MYSLFNLRYSFPVIKTKQNNINFLINEETGGLYSESDYGTISFRNIEGEKWAYSEFAISLEVDLAHFSISRNEDVFMLDNLSITEDKEKLMKMARDYFLQ